MLPYWEHTRVRKGFSAYSFFPLTVITQKSAIFPFFKLSPVSNGNFMEDFVGDGGVGEDLHDTSYSGCFKILPSHFCSLNILLCCASPNRQKLVHPPAPTVPQTL